LTDLEGGVQGLRLGVPERYFQADDPDGIDTDVLDVVQDAIDRYQTLGAHIQKVELPPPDQALAAYYILSTAEASSNLARFDGIRYGRREEADTLDALYTRTRTQGFGKEVIRRIILGTFVLSAGHHEAYYLRALATRRAICGAFEQAFKDCDMIVTPTVPQTAFKLGNKWDPVSMHQLDRFTIPASLAGLPAISLPAGLSPEGLPIGLQLMGPALSETRLLQAARAYEREMPSHPLSPPWEAQLRRHS